MKKKPEYFYTIFNGLDKAGFGSMIQLQLVLFCYCVLNKKKFVFPGFKKLNHWQLENNISQIKFSDSLNEFIPNHDFIITSKNIFTYINENFLMKYWLEFNINKFSDILSNQEFNYKIDSLIFDKGIINVAIHYRVSLPTDTDNFQRNYGEDEFFEKSISLIENKFRNSKFQIHVFTQKITNFTTKIQKTHSAIIYDSMPVYDTFLHFIHADVLVCSKSSLSWSAHLYGKNKLVIGRTFWHPWKRGTILINNKSEIITNFKRKIIAIKYLFIKNLKSDLYTQYDT